MGSADLDLDHEPHVLLVHALRRAGGGDVYGAVREVEELGGGATRSGVNIRCMEGEYGK
jgi:hypothetical protein